MHSRLIHLLEKYKLVKGEKNTKDPKTSIDAKVWGDKGGGVEVRGGSIYRFITRIK